jgi:hypothetical protein
MRSSPLWRLWRRSFNSFLVRNSEACSFIGRQGKEFCLVERRKLRGKGGQTPKEQGMPLFIILAWDLEKKKKVEARCGRSGQGITQLTSMRTRASLIAAGYIGLRLIPALPFLCPNQTASREMAAGSDRQVKCKEEANVT